MSDRKIAVVVNPLAGKGRANAVASLLVSKLYHFAVDYTLYNENWPDDFSEYTAVWIVGGDGTVNYFINRYPGIKIPLTIFKGGTGNDFSWKLYGEADWKEQLDIVLNAKPQPVDAARCNNKLFLNGVGIGFDGEVLESMNTVRLIGGHAGYFFVVLKKIFTFREYQFKIYTDKLLTEGKLLLALVNNSSRTGGGFHVSPKATVNDGLLDLVTCQPLSLWQRLRYLPVIEKGQHLDLPFIQHHTGSKFTIECEKKVAAQLDGELLFDNRFEFEVLKDQFLFLY